MALGTKIQFRVNISVISFIDYQKQLHVNYGVSKVGIK